MGTTLPAETQAAILGAYTSQTPRPSRRQLAKQFGISLDRIQKFLKEYDEAQQATIKAELVAEQYPIAVAEVKALTRDLPITSLCKVMEEAEAQYTRFKDDDPHLAGGYLDQMRKCAIEMAKWLGIDKGLGVQDNAMRFEIEWRRGA